MKASLSREISLNNSYNENKKRKLRRIVTCNQVDTVITRGLGRLRIHSLFILWISGSGRTVASGLVSYSGNGTVNLVI